MSPSITIHRSYLRCVSSFPQHVSLLAFELEAVHPEHDALRSTRLMPLDKLMVARLTQVQAEVDDAYASYEFAELTALCTTSWSYRALNVYLDALKDRLYCE